MTPPFPKRCSSGRPDERRREDSRRPGHEIRRAARRQQARGAAADAQTATFRLLHQDDADHHRGDQCLQDEYEGEKAGYHDFPNSRGLTRTALAAHIETKRLRFKPKDQPSAAAAATIGANFRSEEHTSERQSLMRISYYVFCLQK